MANSNLSLQERESPRESEWNDCCSISIPFDLICHWDSVIPEEVQWDLHNFPDLTDATVA
jgi:hypothetical protein